MKKKEIHKEFEAILSQNDKLKTLLQKFKPDAKLDGFQEEVIQLLGIAMPDGTVTWSGQKKPSMISIVMEIMTKREATDIASKRVATQK